MRVALAVGVLFAVVVVMTVPADAGPSARIRKIAVAAGDISDGDTGEFPDCDYTVTLTMSGVRTSGYHLNYYLYVDGASVGGGSTPVATRTKTVEFSSYVGWISGDAVFVRFEFWGSTLLGDANTSTWTVESGCNSAGKVAYWPVRGT